MSHPTMSWKEKAQALEQEVLLLTAQREHTTAHQHDCDRCTFIGTYRLRHFREDDGWGYDTGIAGNLVTMADVYESCDQSGYRYIVRYGRDGAYATTNDVSRYVLAPLINGEDQYA